LKEIKVLVFFLFWNTFPLGISEFSGEFFIFGRHEFPFFNMTKIAKMSK